MLNVVDVQRSFGQVPVLRGVTLEIEQGEIVCLLGPSGCGKTTLLRIITGLEQLDHGEINLNGKSIIDLPVHQRDFGLMFQDFALFPHMNVRQNVTFGLRMRGMSDLEQKKRLSDVLNLVGLKGFENRDVAQLSGGEKQRVALARCLAPNPHLLMLDEPLGSLDAALRERLVVELREIIKRAGLTAIYVTHDHKEAFAVADRIAVMNAGKIEQVATPERLYREPETVFVAQFLGLHNIVPVTQRESSQHITPLGTFKLPEATDSILLHPDGLRLGGSEGIQGVVQECVFQGEAYRVTIQHASGLILKFKTGLSGRLNSGEVVSVEVLPDFVLPLKH